MKQIRILTAMLTCACLFTACEKKDQGISSLNSSSLVDYNYNTVISYKLVPVLSGTKSSFQWNGGYINATGLIFNAFHKQGDAYVYQAFGNPITQNVSIFNTSVLGVVPLPAIKCDAASFTIQLGTPTLATSNPSSTSMHSFFLVGLYHNPVIMPVRIGNPVNIPFADGIPVQIIVDDSIEINSQYLYNVTIDKTNYWAIIGFSFDQVTRDITPDMMSKAILTNGTILITRDSNPNLYELVLDNLHDNMMQVQFTAQLLNAPVLNAPDPSIE